MSSHESYAPVAEVWRPTTEIASGTCVGTIMSKDVVCVRPDLSLESLVLLLLRRGFSGAPVVDRDGRAVGIVSKTDLIRDQYETADADFVVEQPSRSNGIEVEAGFHAALIARGTVAEVMTRVPITIPADMPIWVAATMMASHDIHRLPVIDAQGAVVGILSALDIVRWFGQQCPSRT
jgi:CBS domain-containing protein